MAKYGRYMSLGKRIALVVVASVLTLGIFCGIIYREDIKAFFGVMGNYSDKIKEEMEEEKEKQEQEEQENTDGETDTNTGFESGNDFMNVSSAGVALAYTNIAQEEFAAYGVAEEAESAMVMTASISPSNATNVNLDWTVSFVNPDSEWATGKTVTDYVTIAEQSETTAVLTNLKPFGEKIQMTVCVADNTAINAVATCDYIKKITAFSDDLVLGNSSLVDGAFENYPYKDYNGIKHFTRLGNEGDNTNIPCLYSSAYTVEDTFTFAYDVKFTSAFVEALASIDRLALTCEADTYVTVTTTECFMYSYHTNSTTSWGASDGVFLHYLDAFVEAMAEIGVGGRIGTVRITATGEYGEYMQEYPLVLAEECVTVPVTAVTLDNVNVQF